MPIGIQRKPHPAITQLVKGDPSLISVLKPGDLVEGRLLFKKSKAAYFDLGKYGTGIVYGVEFSNASEVLKGLDLGGAVHAKVVDQENDEGLVELSLAQATKQKAWQEVKNLLEAGEILNVKIAAANSGGLIADMFEMKAFLPVSQLASGHYPQIDDGDKAKILEELKKFVGQELKVKIIDVNPRAGKLIISEREVTSSSVRELLDKYKVGDLVDGIVSGVADFGAFVRFADNPDIEGLIHISELSHRLIENPKEIVKVNDSIKVKILDIKDGRVSLSLKSLQEDPWLKAAEKYKEGADILGTVTKFNPFGAFVSLDADIQGLIHISEFGGPEEMQKALELGKSYLFNIAKVAPVEKRIILKLKKAA
jgi:small subunit ribosomal protein S1